MADYQYRNACFVCTTPYQVIGAVSIVKSEGIEADIYIFGTFSNHVDLAARLRALNIFKNVYVAENDRTNFFGKGKSKAATMLQMLFQVTFPDRAVSGFLADGVAYETFYTSSRAHGKILMQTVLQKRNPEMKIVIYDDGLGSYLEESHVLTASRTRRRVEKALGRELFDTKHVSIQLYLPEIAKLPETLQGCSITEMPRLDWNLPENIRILKEISGTADSESYSERVILFDNVRGLKNRVEMFRKVDDCYRAIIDVAGYDNVLFKGHPRSVETPDMDMRAVDKQGVPMEVFYAEMEDLGSRILVAYNSTAAYTPKLLFGKEPWIIHLHRIVGPPLQENSETLYQTFLPTYSDPGRLLVPNDTEELKRMLFSILERN